MSVKSISPQELNAWLMSGDTILVDVREADEFSTWRIPRAVSMPLTYLEQQLPSLRSESKKIVFQCLKGKRGEMGALAALDMLGKDIDIYNLAGGIEAWKAEGFEVIQNSNKAKLPIMRQVMIAAGSLVLLSAILDLSGFGWGSYLGAFVGAGLLLAGTTGWCGMAKLLQCMPWNKKN